MTRMDLRLSVDRTSLRTSASAVPCAKRIKVLIAANHAIMQRGIESILGDEQDIDLVGNASNGNEALRLIRELHPDVALLNLSLPEKDALQVVELLGMAALESRTVVLASRLTEQQFLRAVELGVRGILLEDMAAPLLARCIRKVHAGDEFFEKDVLHKSFGKLLRSVVAEKDVGRILSLRELTAVRLAVNGLSNKQIAKKLSVSEGTVKMHLHRAYVKLGIHGRMSLLLYAQREGLV